MRGNFAAHHPSRETYEDMTDENEDEKHPDDRRKVSVFPV